MSCDVTCISTGFASVWLWLASVHPALPWAMVPIAIWLANWAVRTWAPETWDAAANVFGGERVTAWRKAVQIAPSAALGALAGSFVDNTDYRTAVMGALMGLFAPLIHEGLKAAPFIPYVGGKFPAAGLAEPPDSEVENDS